MGLFDRVQIDVQMPGYETPIHKAIFQTKSLGAEMNTYGIDNKGYFYMLYENEEGETMKLYLTIYSGEIRLLSELEVPKEIDGFRCMNEYYVIIERGKLVSARKEQVKYPIAFKESR